MKRGKVGGKVFVCGQVCVGGYKRVSLFFCAKVEIKRGWDLTDGNTAWILKGCKWFLQPATG